MARISGKLVSKLLRGYYRGPDHPMKLRLWDWLRKGLRYSRLTIPYAETGWIMVDERDLLQRQIFVTGAYEPEVWRALAPLVTPGAVVWDVGAHIGSFAIQALLDDRVREVHAFEPDPVHAEILARNLALNRGSYAIHPVALSSRREMTTLYHGPLANTGLSSLVTSCDQSRVVFEVCCQTADEFIFQEGLNPPTLLKIDVEDWELHVLWGARRLLKELPPKAIVFESASHRSGEIIERAVVDDLERLGYKITRIPRPSGIVDQRENYLAVYTAPVSRIADRWEPI